MRQRLSLFLALFCTLCAFFLGYIFAYMQDFSAFTDEKVRQKFVIINTKSNTLHVSTQEESIIFILNGEPTKEKEIKFGEN